MTRSHRHKTAAKRIKPSPLAHTGKIQGFIFTAEVTATEFYPRECFGGFKAVTGYPSSQFLKKDFYNKTVVTQKDAGLLHRFRYSASSAASHSNATYRIVTREGRSITVNEHLTLIREGPRRKLVGGIVTVSDRPDRNTSPGAIRKNRVRFEEMQKLNKHLLEINQLKDEFLANTSHELRTPLNSIIGFLTLITEGYYENEHELHLFTRNALESSYHLLSVINDLLDISRIEAGKMQLQIERVYVDELIEDVSSLFKVQADQKGLIFEPSAKGSPLYASADVRRLKQVLINLAGNALKFTERGGVRVSAEILDGQVGFTIKDTGIGIPRDQQNKLFQKFIQVDGSATRQYGGSGLGLVISKHLIEMMGGHIEIESKGAGTGTTVHFTIPKWTKEDT